MSYSRLFYHFVWSTKERLPLITPANRIPIIGAIKSKATGLRGIVHALNGTQDHMHLVATVPASLSVSKFIGEVKGCSSHLASRLVAGHLEPFAWQIEYGVLSVSEAHLPVVVRYVLNQQRHHAEGSLNARLEWME